MYVCFWVHLCNIVMLKCKNPIWKPLGSRLEALEKRGILNLSRSPSSPLNQTAKPFKNNVRFDFKQKGLFYRRYFCWEECPVHQVLRLSPLTHPASSTQVQCAGTEMEAAGAPLQLGRTRSTRGPSCGTAHVTELWNGSTALGLPSTLLLLHLFPLSTISLMKKKKGKIQRSSGVPLPENGINRTWQSIPSSRQRSESHLHSLSLTFRVQWAG